MTKKILIIDDERKQAEALAFKIQQMFTDAETIVASSEKEIESAIVEKFYNLAILDIRLDNYVKNGIDFARDIIEQNPFVEIMISPLSSIARTISIDKFSILGPKGSFLLNGIILLEITAVLIMRYAPLTVFFPAVVGMVITAFKYKSKRTPA